MLLAACAAHYPDDVLVSRVHAMRPSVVLLTVKTPPENKKDEYDESYATGTVVASGEWGSDILTVQHAIDAAFDIRVTVNNKAKTKGTVIASDKKLDVALVRIPEQHLEPVVLGNSRDLRDQVGRDVALVGYPIPDDFDGEGLGLDTSLSSGRISSIRKDNIEVTVPIVPGESGALLFLVDTGDVVGIAESRFDEERSIGFALPIDEAKAFLHRVDAAHGF